ncbi:MAG: hypothetical protein EXR72_06865 [Myxococcales bacterium]|nr:hypothetical protein [Myxococcales bacterium]
MTDARSRSRGILDRIGALLPFLVPALLLLGLALAGVLVDGGRLFCSTPTLALDLPSERAIPAAVEVAGMQRDMVWQFRYAPIGTEFRSGIPYWIYRAMPRLFPDDLDGRGYEKLGFTSDNDHAYYASRPVPRGLILTDTELQVPPFPVAVRLKRVSFNCASCHRGGWRDPGDRSIHLVDGMPNHTADLQGFKRYFFKNVHSERFNPRSVLGAINEELASLGSPALTPTEELVYTGIVEVMKRQPGREWMDRRADNGPRRLDAFTAVKDEVLGVPDDGTVATVDFPSLWNQGAAIRPWHHWDGNTADSRARNFGSTVGVGGISMSVDKPEVLAVGAWTEERLRPPPWPDALDRPDPASALRGRATYLARCAACHGLYDRERASIARAAKGDLYMTVVDVKTDEGRRRAFPPAAAAVLSEFGGRRNLWGFSAFRGNDPKASGYLALPLDGIWARAPYLHNGSVPTLDKLLGPPDRRPREFYRGTMTYNRVEVGFEYDAAKTDEGRERLFLYRTLDSNGAPIPGNGNQGHEFTVADDAQRADLIEFLKTL